MSANGLLLTLRGINPTPGADPEDMVAVRMWSDGKRIITTRRRRLQAAFELSEAIEKGVGPCNAGEFVESLTDKMVERMADVVDGLSDEVDDLEESVLTMESYELRPLIAELRRHTIGLRRYLAPQREAVSRLFNEKLEWLTDMDRSRLRESADRTTRFVEDLDLARERAVVVQEELTSRLSEKMDRTMYVLSIVAAIFLPLGFLTGLLGINVGGIPGAEYTGSFAIFCLFLLVDCCPSGLAVQVQEMDVTVTVNKWGRIHFPTKFKNVSGPILERTARRLIAQLKEEGLLTETSTRSPLYWQIPEHAEPWYFPQLAPGV